MVSFVGSISLRDGPSGWPPYRLANYLHDLWYVSCPPLHLLLALGLKGDRMSIPGYHRGLHLYR
jgi:hypothetical protein